MNLPKFFPYAKQHISDEDINAASEALRSSSITRGPFVEEFENKVANTCGAKYAVAFNSGTSALLAAFHVTEICPHDRIISSPNTFIATVGCGMVKGAKPIFVDIDLTTGNLDLKQLEEKLKEHQSSRGRLFIVPVHFSGIPVDMKKLDHIIKTPNTVVIEDAAHAIGSLFPDGQKVGCCAWSHLTMFSFHPAKTITTGEGGMITTNDEDLYQRLKRFRNNGIEKDPAKFLDNSAPYEGYYEVKELTGNYNFTDFQAAIGLSQLNRMDEFIQKRLLLMRKYRELLQEMPDLQFLSFENDSNTAYHLCVVQINFDAYHTTRENVISKLKSFGVGSQVHYIPLYRHLAQQNKIPDLRNDYPNMETYFSRTLSLPLYFDLSLEDVTYICTTLKDILVEGRQKRKYFRKKRK